jgi:hypothetical protein
MTVDILIKSGYFDKMTVSDKIARHLDPGMDIGDLIKHYKHRIIPFTEKEFEIIRRLDTRLKAVLRSKWKKAAHVKNIKYVKTVDLENNLPHTHGNVIFVPYTILSFDFDRLFKIIVHEFVHIFQRMEPISTAHLIKSFGYTPQYKRSIISKDYNIRLNPDTNDIIYSNIDGDIELLVYSSETPTSLLDTHNILLRLDGSVLKIMSNSKTEHPYEHMAYALTDKLVEINNFSID